MTSVTAAGRVRLTSTEVEPNLRNVPLGALRGFVTLLVVAHHAFLAYHPYAPPHPKALTENPWWTAFPISDARRWQGIEAFIGFNDVFFMSLMFLISGIFVPSSLRRKGPAVYIRDRLLKLGLPFAVGAALLAPLAYYPSYLAGARAGSFWQQWFALGFWPAGPVWFLWVLIAFGLVASSLQRLNSQWTNALASMSGRLGARPAFYFAALAAASVAVYLPMALLFSAERWFTFGPFAVQSSRVIHYAVYFFAGVGLGAYGTNKGLIATDGKLARRWYLWILLALVAFASVAIAVIATMATLPQGGPGSGLKALNGVCFAVSCAASSLAMMALFLRFSRTSSRMMESLSRNAYGIYLLHYFCVSWLQLALLPSDMPGALKAVLVLAGATASSWALTAFLRRIPAVARIL